MVQHVEVTQVDGTQMQEAASVLIRVPAHRDYIVVVRSAITQLGARLGYTFAEITDLRLAVDEACCLLVGSRPVRPVPKDDLECRIQVRAGVLHVDVTASAAGVDPPDVEGFGWKVLTALVDSLAWARDGDTARIALEKHRDLRGR
jgi:serine/threonine-protein kinase RsbW